MLINDWNNIQFGRKRMIEGETQKKRGRETERQRDRENDRVTSARTWNE